MNLQLRQHRRAETIEALDGEVFCFLLLLSCGSLSVLYTRQLQQGSPLMDLRGGMFPSRVRLRVVVPF